MDPDGIVVTKHGKAVAKLIPLESGQPGLLGCLEGKIRIQGDILSTGASWDAES